MHSLSEIQSEFAGIANLEFLSKQIVEGFITGLHRSPFHGFSVEFAEHRLYNAGESTKNIDWKLFARSDKLFVKKFEEETNLRGHIVIDTSSSMLYPFQEKNLLNKLCFSVFCSAALIHLLRKQRDAVGLSFFSDKVELHTGDRLSTTHAKLLFSKLEELLKYNEDQLKRPTSAAASLHQIAENVHQRSLVVIFSDMFESHPQELFSALQHLRYNKHEVILFNVTDKKRELEFNFQNRPYKFVDMESGAEFKLNPNEIREFYTKKMQDYLQEIKLKCMQFQIDLVHADINGPFKDVLQAYLLKRSQLF